MPDFFAALHSSYAAKQNDIRARLADFAIFQQANDADLFAELVYCIFTAGCSARMGIKALEHARPLLLHAAAEELENKLIGAHRFPRARAGYIIHTRNFLQRECDFQLRQKLISFGSDANARRDFFAHNKGVKGIGYKEASHFLRNIGYRGYAILDKHILNTLFAYEVIASPQPPTTKKKYLALEETMRQFAAQIKIDFDELDLLLWSNKTGEILK